MAEERRPAFGGSNIHIPLSLQELFGLWSRFPGAAPWAGGTALGAGNHSASFLSLPRDIISLERIEELRRIARTERYLEIGAMVRLNEITRLGKMIPDVLIRTLLGAAGYPVRNLVTLGGLVCSSAPQATGTGEGILPRGARSLGAAASFIALDARFELRSAESSRWVSAARFYTPGGRQEIAERGGLPAGAWGAPPAKTRLRGGGLSPKPDPAAEPGRELLTRIRIPLEQWSYSVYRKIQDGDRWGTAVFIARIEKNILMELRVIFASDRIIRSQAGESSLNGKSLPLERRDVNHFVALWELALEEEGRTDPMIRAILLNCIEACALELAD
ncbi:MAG: FAD binding domain-containing protein [Spirochaetaceae bacterium]|jgi:CO/xanthine dehydrogenase FAD-binding subunit|nr:FAD binding domain-containing protein [Spirochaetaceae bacterium]